MSDTAWSIYKTQQKQTNKQKHYMTPWCDLVQLCQLLSQCANCLPGKQKEIPTLPCLVFNDILKQTMQSFTEKCYHVGQIKQTCKVRLSGSQGFQPWVPGLCFYCRCKNVQEKVQTRLPCYFNLFLGGGGNNMPQITVTILVKICWVTAQLAKAQISACAE